MNLLLLATLLATPGPGADFQVHRVGVPPVAIVQEEPPTAPRTKAEIEKDLAEARSANETESIIAYLFELVDFYLAEEDYEEALKQAEEAEKLAAGIEDDSLQYTVQYYLAEAHYGGENAESAIKHFREAMRLAVRIDFKDGEFYTAYRLTLLLEEEELLEEAIKVGREALSLAVEMKDKEIQAELYDVLGNAFYSQEKWDSAITEYSEGLTLYRELKNDAEVAASLEVIGDCYVELEQLEKADTSYAEAIELNRKLNNFTNMPTLLKAHLDVLTELGKSEKGITHHYEIIAYDFAEFMAYHRFQSLVEYGIARKEKPLVVFLTKYTANRLHALAQSMSKGKEDSSGLNLGALFGLGLESEVKRIKVSVKPYVSDPLMDALDRIGNSGGIGDGAKMTSKEDRFAASLDALYDQSSKLRTRYASLEEAAEEGRQPSQQVVNDFQAELTALIGKLKQILADAEKELK